MLPSLAGWNDTIIALATPQGIGAIGVIRLSGSKAFEVVNDLFSSRDLMQQASHTIHVGLLKNGDELLDEVVIALFKNPKSYTGEDVVEISCHGSSYIQQKIIEAFTNKGIRLAKAGEFTQRAFLNGKLDLTQAEAVADVIASNTSASQKTAMHNLRGGFSSILKMFRENLITFSALIELELDFSQEDVEFADRTQFKLLITELSQTTNQLIDSFQYGNVIKNGVSVAIVGKPNVGKSTLLNMLLNENRAIVSAIAGTTRDTIEEVLNIDGILFRLIDTAGIRDSEDEIENIGVERSLEKIQLADVVMYLTTPPTDGDLLNELLLLDDVQHKLILVINKEDTISIDAKNKLQGKYPDSILISAKNNTGINELKDKLVAKVLAGKVESESTIITNTRHYAALKEIQKSIADIEDGMNNNLPGDLLSLDIRRCLHYLGEITGEITNEDQLDFIFSKFCIGK